MSSVRLDRQRSAAMICTVARYVLEPFMADAVVTRPWMHCWGHIAHGKSWIYHSVLVSMWFTHWGLQFTQPWDCGPLYIAQRPLPRDITCTYMPYFTSHGAICSVWGYFTSPKEAPNHSRDLAYSNSQFKMYLETTQQLNLTSCTGLAHKLKVECTLSKTSSYTLQW